MNVYLLREHRLRGWGGEVIQTNPPCESRHTMGVFSEASKIWQRVKSAIEVLGMEGGSEELSQLQPPSHWAGSSSLTQGMWLSQPWDFIQFTVQTLSPGPSPK